MEYWIRLNGEQIGPLTLEEARRMPLQPDTPVWVEGMEDWTVATRVEALADLFNGYPGINPGFNPAAVPPPVPGVAPAPNFVPVAPQRQIDLTGCPNNYIGMSVAALVVLTATCGLLGLLGLVPLLNSARVNNLFLMGMHDRAAECSARAKNWSIACYIIAAVCAIFALALVGIVGTEALLSTPNNPSFLGL